MGLYGGSLIWKTNTHTHIPTNTHTQRDTYRETDSDTYTQAHTEHTYMPTHTETHIIESIVIPLALVLLFPHLKKLWEDGSGDF